MREELNRKIVQSVPREKAFYFFTSIGNYTGLFASSLKEFMEVISMVDAKSLEFHLYRGDFEKWVDEVLGDAELAREIIELKKLGLTGENLRKSLYITVSRRLENLKI
ncbi:MAG: DUF5752 family protein [Candidatus Bathyarchaeia archaeon]